MKANDIRNLVWSFLGLLSLYAPDNFVVANGQNDWQKGYPNVNPTMGEVWPHPQTYITLYHLYIYTLSTCSYI